MPLTFIDRLKLALDKSHAARHRLLLVISGEQQNALVLALDTVTRLQLNDAVLFDASGSASPGLRSVQKAASLLGTDNEAIVYDAWGGFDPDAFGILSGTIVAGGLLVLVTPALKAWPRFADPENKRLAVYPLKATDITGLYLQRLAKIIAAQSKPIDSDGELDCRLLETTSGAAESQTLPTDEQQQVIDAIFALGSGDNKPTALMITADRGRGKSSAMGIAAAQLLLSRRLDSIIISAPSRSTLESFFRHEKMQAGNNDISGLQFIAPDALLMDLPPADLLMIDEAAAIPLPLLLAALKHYPRIVFSSTLHGYEGAGRGFALRFRELLDLQRPDWRALSLEVPVRYAAADPLEALTGKLLMLDADLDSPDKGQAILPENCDFRTFTGTQLLANENYLRSLFALLIQAHYQTKPLDLRHILDGPNLSVHVLDYRGTPIAAVLLATEGLIDDESLRGAIIHGERRPHGHLVPQLLAYQYLQTQYLGLKTARIVRIAVNPELQQRGFGSHLLKELRLWCADAGYDALSSSFGLTTELLAFWRKNSYQLLHLGSRRNASSAAYSAVVFEPLGNTAKSLAMESRRLFLRRLRFRSADESATDLETAIRDEIINSAATFSETKSNESKQTEVISNETESIYREVKSYAYRHRDFEAAHFALNLFFHQNFAKLSMFSSLQTEIINRIILQNQDWVNVCEMLKIQGRKHGETLIKDAIRKILD